MWINDENLSLQEELKKLTPMQFERLNDWLKDPIWDLDVFQEDEINRKFQKAAEKFSSTAFVIAALADMVEKIIELEATIIRLKRINNLKDLEE